MSDISNDRQDKLNLISKMLRAIGEVPEREGLRKTPERVVSSWEEIFKGYKQDIASLFDAKFTSDPINNDLIIIKNIKYYSVCEHHLLPVVGVANICYIPHDSVLGLSKFARVVDCFARRLQMQERMTAEIAGSIMQYLKPRGVGVHLSAQHYCMIMRGIQSDNSQVETLHFAGDIDDISKQRFIHITSKMKYY